MFLNKKLIQLQLLSEQLLTVSSKKDKELEAQIAKVIKSKDLSLDEKLDSIKREIIKVVKENNIDETVKLYLPSKTTKVLEKDIVKTISEKYGVLKKEIDVKRINEKEYDFYFGFAVGKGTEIKVYSDDTLIDGIFEQIRKEIN